MPSSFAFHCTYESNAAEDSTPSPPPPAAGRAAISFGDAPSSRSLSTNSFGAFASIADAHRRELDVAVEMEGRGDRARILRIDAVDRVEDHRAIFDRAAERPDAVLRPRQHHSAVPRHSAERRTQRAEPALARRRHDRARRLRADAERDATRRRRRRWAGRRSARAAANVPRVVRAAADTTGRPARRVRLRAWR